jgi:hypothetical protein
MQFRSPAPANLTQEGSNYYADWSVASGNFGHTDSEVAAWVASALNDSRGLPAVGITPRQVGVGQGRVIFQVVETIPKNPGAIGIAYWNSVPVVVLLEEAWFGNMDLVTHEALHAFLYAIHSPEGSDSLLEPMEDPGEEWLSPTDIEQIEAWLSGDWSGTWYWFPGDLPYYITHWIVPEGAKTRLVLTVFTGTAVVLKAVYAETHEAMLSGDFQPFGIGVSAGEQGFWTSEWVDAPAGEFYIGIIAEGASPDDFQDLAVSVAEVQLASPSATGGGSPIPS